ncbi:DUF4406 domain-containing protein [Desulfosporosinus sp. SB140]|uniref:DUF4406 domain-containing protein n=1 Tax=Desulfosporosinus paludis TaxID=3115649 RepID=UPI00388DEEB7
MKAYVAGKINGNEDFKSQFDAAQQELESQGYVVMNPSVLSKGFEQMEYLHVCKAMIDVCDVVFFLPNWKTSCGSNYELGYATGIKKEVRFL